MRKILMSAAIVAASGCLFIASAQEADEQPDIFDGLTPLSLAVPHPSSGAAANFSGCFTGDLNQNPQTIFYPGQPVVWWCTGIVTPQGTGPVSQTEASLVTTVPIKTGAKTFSHTFSSTFTICNTSAPPSTPQVCDDGPLYTTWSLGVYVNLPKILNFVLFFTGPISFNSDITGSGYETYSASLSGNSVAITPKSVTQK
jgi:hypothetical protein